MDAVMQLWLPILIAASILAIITYLYVLRTVIRLMLPFEVSEWTQEVIAGIS